MDSDLIIGLIVLAIPFVLITWFIVFLVTRPKRQKEFYESGELKHIYFQKKKKGKVKKETFFYRNGQKNKIKNWKKGVLEGQTLVFYPTGEKYIESNYKKGKLNGPYTVFAKDGSVLESFTYNEGVVS